MAEKTNSLTFKQITSQQSIEDILNQSNITLKNKKGIFKERHGGLTVKFSNNININELSQNKTQSNNEVATQTENNDKKNIDNFTKYKYNSATFFEDKKIRELRKKIFLLEEELKNTYEKDKNLIKEIHKNSDEYKLKDEELYKLEAKLIDIETAKNNEKSNLDYWNKSYFHKEKIENKKSEISKIREKNKDLCQEMKNNTFKIYELESNIYQLTEELNKYIYEFNTQSTPTSSWIKKSDEIAELQKKFKK